MRRHQTSESTKRGLWADTLEKGKAFAQRCRRTSYSAGVHGYLARGGHNVTQGRWPGQVAAQERDWAEGGLDPGWAGSRRHGGCFRYLGAERS